MEKQQRQSTTIVAPPSNQNVPSKKAAASANIPAPTTTNQQPNLAQADGPAVRSRNQSSGIKKSNSQGSGLNQTGGNGSAGGTFSENDTFNKHYNKELRVSKDEIPIVLGELNDSAIQFIKREQWEKALNLLQKAYGIMDVVDFSLCRRDKFNLFILFHNMALCYQKLQMLEECAQCIEQSLEYMPADQFNLEERSVSNRMRKLHLICKLKLQYCAILSQVHRHKDALEQSKEGVKISHHLINDMRQLCEFYIKREDIEQSYGANNVTQNNINNNNNSRNNNAANQVSGIDTEMTYNSYRSQRKEQRQNKQNGGASRNRSFSQFLSQQEAYNSDALIFHQSSVTSNLNNNLMRNSGFPKQQQIVNQIDQQSQNLSSFYSLNFLEESMSYLERTARKLMPILTEIKKRMVPEKNLRGKKGKNNKIETLDTSSINNEQEIIINNDEQQNSSQDASNADIAKKAQQPDMKNILGYLNQGEWTQALSIGSIMQLQPFCLKDLLEQGKNELELTRESFIQKVSLISVAYFCYSTEIRFILQMKEDPSYEPGLKQKESEYWHAKALEIACTFLPSECPLLNHINLSYQKHFAPVKQTILEEEAMTDDLKVVKPLNGIDNPKFQPIIRQLSNIQVSITPYQMTPLNQITSQFLSQMVTFNEYQEQGFTNTNHQASVKSQLGNNSIQHHRQSKSGDMNAIGHVLAGHKRVTTADQHLLAQNQGKLIEGSRILESRTGSNGGGGIQEEDDMVKFERLFEKLMKENKIDKIDLLRKLQQKDGPQQMVATNEHSSIAKNVLEERESCQSNDMLLDEHIMAEEDSQLQDDEDHIASEAQHQAVTNHNLYKFRNPETERPKTSNGNQRANNSHHHSSIGEEKLSQMERINQYHKHVEEKKKGSNRPLSGGLTHKIKSENQKSRVNKVANPQNLSMYDKFGSGMALGSSPEKHVQLSTYHNHNPSLGSKGIASNHSQYLTSNQTQSQIIKNNSATSHHHLQVQQSKLNYHNINNPSQITQANQSMITGVAQKSSNASAPIDKKGSEPSNLQAYDELKKRLLSEYKKLTSGKKSFDEQVREKYKNLKQRAVSGNKKTTQVQHQIPNPQPQTHQATNPQPSSNQSNLVSQYQAPQQQLSPRHHLNVYKPTFIINNSFAGEGGQGPTPTQNQNISQTKDIEILDEISKKYRPASKLGVASSSQQSQQYPNNNTLQTSQQQPLVVGISAANARSSSITSIGLNQNSSQPIPTSSSQTNQTNLSGGSSFHHERQQQQQQQFQPHLNNQQLLGMLMSNQDNKKTSVQSTSLSSVVQKKSLKTAHHQSQLSQPNASADLNYVKQFMASNESKQNNIILGVSNAIPGGVNQQQQQIIGKAQINNTNTNTSQSGLKPSINGYSTQQQFNQFSQLQQQHQQQQQLHAQQYPLGGPAAVGTAVSNGIQYKMSQPSIEQQQQQYMQNQQHSKRGNSNQTQQQMLVASSSNNIKSQHPSSHAQQVQYEKLKKKLANY